MDDNIIAYIKEGNILKIKEKVNSRGFNTEYLKEYVDFATNENKIDVLLLFLNLPIAAEILNFDLIFCNACQNNNIDIIKLLVNDNRINLNKSIRIGINNAAHNNNIEILTFLLTFKNINISQHSIFVAAEYGHFRSVEILIKDKRIDPSFNQNHAIQSASFKGHIDIVSLLWNLYTVQKSLPFHNRKLYEQLKREEIINKIQSF